MTNTDQTEKTKATRELDRLNRRFTGAEDARDQARDVLHAAIIKHLHARSAPPGKLSDHTPYDRNHVGRLGKAAGVTPLKGAGSDPNEVVVYDEATMQAAYTELDKLTAAFHKAEDAVDKAREPLHEAMTRIYAARTLGPGEIAEHVAYDRNHVQRVVRTGGAPYLRPRAKAGS
ncbi:hypothetical protein SUDANB1_05625 [Streptomyces sp. enrichment culture]|uniref:hypothetical protein n=1 Tax=Streptomyces sp. enrichment culture TaxID=1795815 RepID=UPI003F5514C7